MYDKLLQELEIPANLRSRERLQRLIDVDENQLTAAMVPVSVIPVITFGPCDDSYLIGPRKMPVYSDYSNFQPPSWCTRIMIGDVANECIIWNKSFRSLDAEGFISRVRSFLGSDAKADRLLSLYNVDPQANNDDNFWKMEKFTTDGLYTAVNWSLIRACPSVYAYHFDVPSPFDNDWAGLAHHSLDNVYIWSLLRERLPPKHRKVSENMSRLWLDFASGKEPWERFDKQRRVMVFREDGSVMRSVEEDATRGYEAWEQVEREGLLDDFHRVAGELCMHWEEITDLSKKPKAMVVGSMSEYGIIPKKKAEWV